MIRRPFYFVPAIAALAIVFSSTVAAVQQTASPPKPPVDAILFKVTVVISRWQGEKAEKRVSSIPFTLFVPNGERSSVRMGGQIPVPSTTFVQESKETRTSTSYQPVGTSIDASSPGAPPDNGRYRLKLTVSDNQVTMNDSAGGPAGSAQAIRAMPTYQTFSSDTWLLIRDGETVQYTTATDKVSGEVTKVDVTLNVLK